MAVCSTIDLLLRWENILTYSCGPNLITRVVKNFLGLVLSVDPAVPCKLALVLQCGLGAPVEHRVRPKGEGAFIEVQES